jgi:hypothetical protein
VGLIFNISIHTARVFTHRGPQSGVVYCDLGIVNSYTPYFFRKEVVEWGQV